MASQSHNELFISTLGTDDQRKLTPFKEGHQIFMFMGIHARLRRTKIQAVSVFLDLVGSPLGRRGRIVLATAVFIFVPTAPASADIHSLEVNSYSESIGVPKDIANDYLEVQRKANQADIIGTIKRELSDSYAGAWFDANSGKLVIAVSASAGDETNSVNSKGAISRLFSSASLEGDYYTTGAQFSWSQLESSQDKLDETLRQFIADGLVKTSLSARTNAVVVALRATADPAKLTIIKNLANNIDVNVEFRTAPDSAFEFELAGCNDGGAFLRYCNLPMRGGTGITGGNGETGEVTCTAGFRANGNDGRKYILTAGHCGHEPSGATYWSWWSYDGLYQGDDKRYIGALNQWHFPGKDWAKIDATNTWADTPPWPTQLVYWGGVAENYPIWGEGNAIEGAGVCHSGVASGTSCGLVTDTNVSGAYGGIPFNGAVEVKGKKTLCLAAGDSGGPFFASNIAYGILSGGLLSCPGAEITYMPIKDATADLNVNVAGPGAPEVITGSPTTLEPYRAVVGGEVNANQSQTYYHFEYGKGSYSSSTPTKDGGSGQGWFSTNGEFTGLDPASTYKYRIMASNSLNTTYGGEGAFTTPAAPPKVIAEAADHIRVEKEDGKASLHGTINPGGVNTTYRFEWGPTQSYGSKVEGNAGSGITAQAVETVISGLVGNRTYYFRLFAQNEKGVAEAKGSFTTPDWRPGGVLEAADHLEVVEEEGQATLHGKINPKGFKTHYHFEWGTQSEFAHGEYNHRAPETDANVGSGQGNVSVQRTIKGVKGETTYHFRLIAESVEGKSPNNEDKSFITPDWRPKLWTVNVGRIDGHKATLEARIESSGFDTHYHFEWGTQLEYEEEGVYSHSVPVAPVDIGSEHEYVEVSHTLNGLRPHIQYHYRLVAESVEGARIREGTEFTTWASAFVPEWAAQATVSTPESAQFTLELETTGGEIYCTGAHMQGTVGSSSESLSMSPTETPECYWFGWATPIEMNGCRFEFEPGAPAQDGSFGGEVSIGPPGCGPITSEAYFGPPYIEIPSQIGVPASYENVGEGSESAVMIKPHSGSISICGDCGYLNPFYGEQSGIRADSEAGWEATAKSSEGKARGLEVKSRLDGTTESATNVGAQKATLHATIYPVGSKVNYGFQYGNSTEYGQSSEAGMIEAGIEDPVQVSKTIEGLEPNTTYHFRIAALGGGFVAAEDLTFTTKVRPSALTDPATYANTLEPHLNATINPEGAATNYWFEYDTSPYEKGEAGHGIMLPASPKGLGSSTEALSVSEGLKGLQRGQTYHYRVMAESEAGLSEGEDRSFTTLSLCENGKEQCQWSLRSTPNPPQPPNRSKLGATSCPSQDLCLATGYDANAERSFGQHWDGSQWVIDELLKELGSDPQGIACPTEEECLTVGYAGSSATVEVWGEIPGWSWFAVEFPSVPGVPGAANAKLNDISCSSQSNCTAVGSYYKEGQTKTLALRLTRQGEWSWSVSLQATANPELGPAVLRDVSCPTASSCMAVGTRGPDTFAEHWDGEGWSIVSTPDPESSEYSHLESVSCGSASTCTAVGYFNYTVENEEWGVSEEFEQPLILRWQEGSWSAQSIPDPSEANRWTELWDVSCLSASSCTAVGSYATERFEWLPGLLLEPSREETLVLVWDGEGWSVQESPNPEGEDMPRLTSVSCPTQVDCEAVGEAWKWQGSSEGGWDYTTLGEGRNEGTWSLRSTPNPPQPPNRSKLGATSCPSQDLCLATGYDANAERSFGQHWDGSQWVIDELLKELGSDPQGIACPTEEECLTVGYAGSSATIEVWGDIPSWTWLAVQTPSVPAIGGTSAMKLNDVSCSSSSDCTAVGRYTKEGKTKTLALSLTRQGEWSWSASLQASADPESGSAELRDVSCPTSSACVAVGTHGTEALAESFDGEKWAIDSAPTPEGTEHIYLESVSCSSPGVCTAVGRYTYAEENEEWLFSEEFARPLSLRFEGGSWSEQSIPDPSGGNRWAQLWDVSCLSASSCTAVGSYATERELEALPGLLLEPSRELTLALTWDGEGWSVQESPNPEGEDMPRLTSVSCPTQVDCEAVGEAWKWQGSSEGGWDYTTLGEGYE